MAEIIADNEWVRINGERFQRRYFGDGNRYAAERRAKAILERGRRQPASEISKEFGIPVRVLCRMLAADDYQRYPRKEGPRGREWRKKECVRLHRQGIKMQDIADRMGIHRTNVLRTLRAMGERTSPPGPQKEKP